MKLFSFFTAVAYIIAGAILLTVIIPFEVAKEITRGVKCRD